MSTHCESILDHALCIFVDLPSVEIYLLPSRRLLFIRPLSAFYSLHASLQEKELRLREEELRVKESLAHAVLQDEFGGNTTELQVEELKRQNEIILKDKETIRLENQMFRQLTVSQELSSKKVRTLL
jgi:hypothetical protein